LPVAEAPGSFAEDKRMIEAQQRIWDLTPPDRKRLFLPQDKALARFRRLVDCRLALEQPRV
jgi:vanillate O-demethylase monooxygenase subunit